jgi:hypothetical protein
MPKTYYVDEPPAYRLKRYDEIIGSYDTAKAVLKVMQLGDVVYTADDVMLTKREELEALAAQEKK